MYLLLIAKLFSLKVGNLDFQQCMELMNILHPHKQNSISTDKHTSFTIVSFHVFLVTSEDKYSSCLVIKYGIIYNCKCSLSASSSVWMNFLCKKDKPRHIAENSVSILGFNFFSF